MTNATLTPVERRRRTVAGVAFLIGLAALIATIAPALGGGSSSPTASKQDAKALPDAKAIVAREQRQKRINARRDRAAAKRRKAANKEWKAWKKQADALKNGTTEANSPSQSAPSTPSTQQQAPATTAQPQQQAPPAPAQSTPATPAAPQQQAPAGGNDPRYYRGN